MHKLECGCVVVFQNMDLDAETAYLEIRVDFCQEHNDISIFAGPDWVRFETRRVDDAGQSEEADSGAA